MAITKPVKNQIAHWEKINVINDASGDIVVDISKSTTHKITLVGNANILISDISSIPDDSIVTFSILFIGNGTYTATLPSNCKTTSGNAVGNVIPNTKIGIQLFSIDKGVSWKVSPFTMDF